MATAAICPIVGTTTTALPPSHPVLSSDPEARCPVTNAKVQHHNDVVHKHPSSGSKDAPPAPPSKTMDASACPALKNANTSGTLTDATCPVVGPVNAHLPPTHPALNEKDAGKVCPVTNATLDHHKGKVEQHVPVPSDAPAQKCPVAGKKA